MISNRIDVPILEVKRIFKQAERFEIRELEGYYRLIAAACGESQMRKYKEDSLSIAHIEEVLSVFQERDYMIIRQRFWDRQTLYKIANDYNITHERARQIQEKILLKICCAFSVYNMDKLSEGRKQLEVLMSQGKEKESDIKIELLPFSTRAYNALKHANINTVGELLSYSTYSLLGIRNIGEAVTKEIEDKLYRYLGIETQKFKREKAKTEIDLLISQGKAKNIAVPIDALELSNRPYMSLRHSGIDTIGKLISMSEMELLEVNNMGKISLMEIRLKLKNMFGLDLNKGCDDNIETKDYIETLGFSNRTYNALRRVGIYSVEQLLSKSQSELLEIKSLGSSCISEIIEKLKMIRGEELKKGQDQIPLLEIYKIDEISNYNIPIEALHLPERIVKLLKKSQIKNIDQLLYKTEQDLLSIWGVNKAVIAEIENRIKIFSLKDASINTPSVISILNLPRYVISALHKHDIYTLQQLMTAPCEKILRISELDKQDVLRIVEKQKEINL